MTSCVVCSLHALYSVCIAVPLCYVSCLSVCLSLWCVCMCVCVNSLCGSSSVCHFITCVKISFLCECFGSSVCACDCMHVSFFISLRDTHVTLVCVCVFRRTCHWPGSLVVWPQSLSASVCLCHSSWTERRCCSSYWCPSSSPVEPGQWLGSLSGI